MNCSPFDSCSQAGAVLGLCLATLALLLLAMAPLGWRAGWWHFRFAFTWLISTSGLMAAVAAVVSLLTLLRGWSALGGAETVMAAIGLCLGALLAYVPWNYSRVRAAVPRIHDISTDTDNPPAFQAVLPARAAEKAATEAYAGPELVRQQKAAYPDLAPLFTALPSAKAFERALEVASTMPGWTVVAAEPSAGRIEASQTSRWFGFTDDIVIRVEAGAAGSRVDMRSLSRQGRSDFGVNAARIRGYMATLKRRIG